MTTTLENGPDGSGTVNPDAAKWDTSTEENVYEAIPYDPSMDDGEIVQGEVIESPKAGNQLENPEQDSSGGSRSEELKQLEDEFGMNFGQEVTVERNASEENPEAYLEDGWYVGGLTTNEDGNKFVKVMKADPDNKGSRLVKDYPLERLQSLQPDTEEDPAESQVEVADENEVERNPELPPQATLLERAANRLAKFNVNRAHKKGLKENNRRDVATQQERVDAQEDAFASYEENIAHTEERDRQEDEAWDKNEKIDKEAARAERIEEGKEQIRVAGRSITSALAEAGVLTAVGTKLAIESAGQGAKKTAESVKSGAETAALAAMLAKDKAKSVAETAALKGMFAYDKTKEATGEAYTATLKKAISLKETANKRIKSRWDKILSGGKEKYQSAKNSLRTRRTAGRLAFGAYRDHMDAMKSDR